MADGDSATVDIELLIRYFQLPLAVQRLAGERLVDLEQIDVADAEAGPLEQFADSGHRADAHLIGIHADDRGLYQARQRFKAQRLSVRGTHDHAHRRTVVQRT